MRAGLVVAGLILAGVGAAVFFRPQTVLDPLPAEAGQSAGGSGFAADRVAPLEIDGKRFQKYLEQVCAIGPRISGTAGMRRQQTLLIEHFEKAGLQVRKQTFQAKQVTRAETVEMTNLIVSIRPEKKRRAILCCHYDTRPYADQEPDPRKRGEPFVSANDGASGVAFFMEWVHHLDSLKHEIGLDLVIFDGEEFVWDRERDKYFLGSAYFADKWRSERERPTYVGAVLLDMIAGKSPRFPAEGHSYYEAKDLCMEIWGIARELKCKTFVDRVGQRVLDDHLELLRVGIPAIDIIDFDYVHWHRLSDTPANCDPEGPRDVAKVLSVWLQKQR